MKTIEKPFLLLAFTALSMIEVPAVVAVDSALQGRLTGEGAWV